MNNPFEFLGSTTFAQYLPCTSLVHRRDPRSRLVSYFVFFTCVIFVNNFIGLGISFFVIFLFFLIAHIPIKSSLKSIRQALPFLFILALMQIILSKDPNSELLTLNVLGVAFTKQALINASMLVLKFILLILLLNGFAMTISTSQITSALFYLLKPVEKIGFPINDLTMVVQITMRYLPLISQTAEKIAKAQAARGGDWEQSGFNPIRQAKRVLPLIVPLMVNSLKRAEIMALAMESRGFNAAQKRSSFYSLKFDWFDMLFVLISIVVSALIIGTNFLV